MLLLNTIPIKPKAASLLATVVLGFSLIMPAVAQNADDVLERIRGRYDGLVSLQARFVQTVSSDYLVESERFSGTFVFQGNRYRVHTGSQTIVTDGVTTWVHNIAENQVLISDYVEDESAFLLTSFLQTFDQDYESTFAGTEILTAILHDRMDLEPNDDFAPFTSIRLWSKRSDGTVTRLLVIDPNDVEMQFELSDIVFNPELEPQTFQFHPPADVEIIDLRG